MIANKTNMRTNSSLLANIAFCFIPISFIFGNLITNINSMFLCLLGIFLLKSEILKIKFDRILKIIFLFFLVIFFSTALSFLRSFYMEGYQHDNFIRLAKSILFLRFFLLLIIIYLLNKFNILNIKYFFISTSFAVGLISFDIIFQYIFSFNLIGLESYGHHNTSFFGDEYIAGGYIQNFSFFLILLLAFTLKNKKKVKFILTAFSIFFLTSSILLSGNRMPLILFLFGLFLLFLFNRELRKIILAGLVSFFILFQFIIYSDPHFKNSYGSLYSNIGGVYSGFMNIFKTKEIMEGKDKKSEDNLTVQKEKNNYSFPFYPEKFFLNTRNSHLRLFLTAIDTWEKNIIFGNGIKSFRVDCSKLRGAEYNLGEDLLKFKKNRLCSNHPHNYYLEILTETGIVGFFIFSILGFLFLFFIFKNLKTFQKNNMENFILLGSSISLILEIFPIKVSGSIFTTNNATYIILLLAIILSYRKLPN